MTESQSFTGGCKEKYQEPFLGWATLGPSARRQMLSWTLSWIPQLVSAAQGGIRHLLPFCITEECVKVDLKQSDQAGNTGKA